MVAQSRERPPDVQKLALTPEMRRAWRSYALKHFARLVAIHTTSDEEAPESVRPSTKRQQDALAYVEAELRRLGVAEVHRDNRCVYATIRGSEGCEETRIFFASHVDTSPAAPGENVKLVRHEGYDGSDIRFEADPNLVLSAADYSMLRRHEGRAVYTTDGRTLLGADDKAGGAGMLGFAMMLMKHPELLHCTVILVFTTDEEIGEGALGADRNRLCRYGYAVDGGEMGELGTGTFNAMQAVVTLANTGRDTTETETVSTRVAVVTFNGAEMHPGLEGPGKMVNALRWASPFVLGMLKPEFVEANTSLGMPAVAPIARCQKTMLRIPLRSGAKEADAQALLEGLRNQVMEQVAELAPGLTIEIGFDDAEMTQADLADDQSANALVWLMRLLAKIDPKTMPRFFDGQGGFFYPEVASEASGDKVVLKVLLRDFDRDGIEKRAAAMRTLIAALTDEARRLAPGLTIEQEIKNQYPNMAEALSNEPLIVNLATAAITASGYEVSEGRMPAGTDGALLSRNGDFLVPTLPTGMGGIHSCIEFVGEDDIGGNPDTEEGGIVGMLLEVAHQWALHAQAE